MSMLSARYFHKQLRQTTWIPSSAHRLHQTCLSVLFNYFALLFGKQKSLFSFLSTTRCICSPNSTTPTHTRQPLDQFYSMSKSLGQKIEGKVSNAGRLLNKSCCLKKGVSELHCTSNKFKNIIKTSPPPIKISSDNFTCHSATSHILCLSHCHFCNFISKISFNSIEA